MAICTQCGAVGDLDDLKSHICTPPPKNKINKPSMNTEDKL